MCHERGAELACRSRMNVSKPWSMSRSSKQFRRFTSFAVLIFSLVVPIAEAALRTVEVPEEPASAGGAAPAEVGGEAAVERDEFYDRSNPGYSRLQHAREALGDLPIDQDGRPDWMKALRSQSIAPRQRIDGAPRNAPLDLDVIMRNTKQMPNVRFPHRAHTEWLECANCHPQPFAEKAGSTAIRMEEIFRGRFCGMCHDRVAFVTHRNCYRCHSVPQEPAAAGR
jgi:c(7)-type cytochrome triheme protein